MWESVGTFRMRRLADSYSTRRSFAGVSSGFFSFFQYVDNKSKEGRNVDAEGNAQRRGLIQEAVQGRERREERARVRCRAIFQDGEWPHRKRNKQKAWGFGPSFFPRTFSSERRKWVDARIDGSTSHCSRRRPLRFLSISIGSNPLSDIAHGFVLFSWVHLGSDDSGSRNSFFSAGSFFHQFFFN